MRSERKTIPTIDGTKDAVAVETQQGISQPVISPYPRFDTFPLTAFLQHALLP
jgi:hypothetical protein